MPSLLMGSGDDDDEEPLVSGVDTGLSVDMAKMAVGRSFGCFVNRSVAFCFLSGFGQSSSSSRGRIRLI